MDCQVLLMQFVNDTDLDPSLAVNNFFILHPGTLMPLDLSPPVLRAASLFVLDSYTTPRSNTTLSWRHSYPSPWLVLPSL